ncbi:hypothetical protein [Georgenia sp. AZ-5]|uniref:hypothetical protein n=1 Tax=Georgenia sp. AZ-5 TaxID=3367526 RepID=UPI003755067A
MVPVEAGALTDAAPDVTARAPAGAGTPVEDGDGALGATRSGLAALRRGGATDSGVMGPVAVMTVSSRRW